MIHTIWSNDNIDIKDWEDFLEEEYPEVTDDYEKFRICSEMNDEYLEDEKMNLNKELGNQIVIIGEIERWDGRRHGYLFAGSTNLNGIFKHTCGDYCSWFVEDDELKCIDAHHDGTNIYTYRLLKKDVTDDDFEDLAYDGLDNAVEKYTEPMGHYVKEIYGWE